MDRGRDLPARVIDAHLTYLTEPKLTGLIDLIVSLDANGVPGDLVECGIALGGSAICIASHLTGDRNFFGFDNFDVIPPPDEIDGESPNLRYEIIKSGESKGIAGEPYYGYVEDRLAVVARNFETFGLILDDRRIKLVKGLFDTTMQEHLSRPIALAHIDCDWYQPVKYCLDVIYPLLSDGGFIVVDDYLRWEGCTAAVTAFCSEHRHLRLSPYDTYAVLSNEIGP